MIELQYKQIVEAAGAKYVGVVLGRVSFQNSYGSTIGLPPEELTVENVRKAIAASDAKFAGTELHPLLAKFKT